MNRNILTALDTIEEQLKFIRQQLEADPSALQGVSAFHGAQEILREHAPLIKAELPDAILDKSVWFITDIHNPDCTPVAQNFFSAITEDGSTSPDVDDIYKYYLGLVRGAGATGTSLSFDDLTALEWAAFQDMYQTAMRDLRKKTMEVPEMMVSVFTTYVDDTFADTPRVNHVTSAYAYHGLLNDELALNMFLDDVYAKVNATRLTDGVSLDGFMVTCPEVEHYQTWVVRTGGFAKLLGHPVEAVSAAPIELAGDEYTLKHTPTAAIIHKNEIVDAVAYAGDVDMWLANIGYAAQRVAATNFADIDDVKLRFAALTPELRMELDKTGVVYEEMSFDGPLDILAKNAPHTEPLTTVVFMEAGTVVETIPYAGDIDEWANQITASTQYFHQQHGSNHPIDIQFTNLPVQLKEALLLRGFKLNPLNTPPTE
jgi:hypothetical protein